LCRARGRYVAICEGDDYWISKDKLSGQVAYLEANPACAFIFHNALIGPGGELSDMRPFNPRALRDVTVRTVIEKDWFVPTASIVCNLRHLTQFPAATTSFPSADLALQILLAANGSVHYVDELMSVYRINKSSVSHGFKRSPEKLLEYGTAFIRMLGILNETLGFSYSRSFNKRIKRTRHWMDFIKFRYQGKCSISIFGGAAAYALSIVTRQGKAT
jgi:hypothetical protein